MWTQEAALRLYAGSIQEVPAQKDVTSLEHLVSGKRVVVTVPSFHVSLHDLEQFLLWRELLANHV
jgi:hypothetical protein